MMEFDALAIKTLLALRPGAKWAIKGDNFVFEKQDDGTYDAVNVEWYDDTQAKPTREEIESEYVIQNNIWCSTEYQRMRAPEYPPLSDLADALYHQANGDSSKMESYLAACEAVKQKYPKGE